MATAEINELFEQGATLAADLAENADEAAETIGDMVERAVDLGQRVESEGEEARRLFKDLAARLEQAEQQLEDARGRAKGGLDALADKSSAVGQGVSALLDQVKRHLELLEAQKAKLQDDLLARAEAAGQDFEELAKRIHDLETATAEHLEQAAEDVSALRSAVGAARAELAARQAEWSEGVDELEHAAQEHLKTWAGGLMGLLGGQTEAMMSLANHTIDRHNETMEELKQLHAEQAVSEAVAALEPAQDALAKLGELCVARQGELSGAAAQIVGKVQAALPLMDQIRAVLQSAQALG